MSRNYELLVTISVKENKGAAEDRFSTRSGLVGSLEPIFSRIAHLFIVRWVFKYNILQIIGYLNFSEYFSFRRREHEHKRIGF